MGKHREVLESTGKHQEVLGMNPEEGKHWEVLESTGKQKEAHASPWKH